MRDYDSIGTLTQAYLASGVMPTSEAFANQQEA